MLSQSIANYAHLLSNDYTETDPVINRIGNARLVLLGEASHGTYEFYKIRAEITKRLIKEKNFNAVVWEADWPDTNRVNRYVKGYSRDKNVKDALLDFKRFPSWLWRNDVVAGFIDWLKNYNSRIPDDPKKCGVYGMDLYSMHSSIEEVIKYLDVVDPEAAQRARGRYSCFNEYGKNAEHYGYMAGVKMKPNCEKEVIEQLVELNRNAFNYKKRDGLTSKDEFFFAEQNAKIVKNAEEYYRSMFGTRDNSWNLRDTHMMDMIQTIKSYLSNYIKNPGIIVWAHNSHLGDARATESSKRGELNIGQLAKEYYNENAVSIGFTTYSGVVTAASNWGDTAEKKKIKPGMKGSIEKLFHETGIQRFILIPDNENKKPSELYSELLERAIGVIYRPESERHSHYFYAVLPKQFDMIIHIDETSALSPLESAPEFDSIDLPETFPTGI